MSEKTTITLTTETKKRMDAAKIHPRETYEDEIKRWIKQQMNHKLTEI